MHTNSSVPVPIDPNIVVVQMNGVELRFKRADIARLMNRAWWGPLAVGALAGVFIAVIAASAE